MNIYRRGFVDAMVNFAHWKNGVQEVGTGGTKLSSAIKNVEDNYNYCPPRTEGIEDLINEAKHLIWKVENGYAHSKKSYKAFKEALSGIEEEPKELKLSDPVHCNFCDTDMVVDKTSDRCPKCFYDGGLSDIDVDNFEIDNLEDVYGKTYIKLKERD